MSRVLIVEDDRDIADLIAHYLQRAGYVTESINEGSAALARAQATLPDLVILDLMLPGMDGMSVCEALRKEPVTAPIPVLMLTARGDESDRVAGLDQGADDYVTKPFSPKELVARVGALLRRAKRNAPGGVLRYGALTINVDKHSVEVNGEPVTLTAKEFLLLQYLVQHRGRVLSRDVLLSDVWGYHYTGGTRTVDVHIRRLREKLPAIAESIVTVKQFGYKLEDQPSAGP
jgi:DNA-binding response OmpR family regulator